MIKTFDFLFEAQRKPGLADKLRFAMRSCDSSVICTETHRLSFNADTHKVLVEACSKDAPYSVKIIPMQISFRALTCMLDGVWDDFVKGDISRV